MAGKTVKKVVSTMKIVNKAVAFNSASEVENTEKFYKMLISHKENLIQDRQHELKTLELEYTRNKTALSRKLEDAQQKEAESLITIDVDSIKTNADRESYILSFTRAVNQARQNVEYILDNLEALDRDHDASVERLQHEISQLTIDIEEING